MRSISCIHAASLLDDKAGGLLTRRPEKTSSREGCISVTSCFHLQKATYSSGTVRDFHPIPLSAMLCKVTNKQVKNKKK